MSKACILKGRQQNFIFQRGQASSCCRAWAEPLNKFSNFIEIQQHWNNEAEQLSQGIELPGCQHCWKAESQGIQSYRQTPEPQPDSINIFFDNLCNQMCSYCGPNYSSVWQESVATHNTFKWHPIAQDNKTANIDFWLTEIKNYVASLPDDFVVISLLGGEPLMQIKNLQVLQQFDHAKIKKLNIVTNLNPPSSKFLHQVFELFPVEKLHFSISIDTTPEYNHIPRWGFLKQRFSENFEFIKSTGVHFQIMSVASVLGILDLPNHLAWISQHRHEINLINNPDCLDPKYLPKHIRTQILEDCSKFDLPNHVFALLSHNDDPVDNKIKEQYNYLKQYFTMTGIEPEHVQHNMFQTYWAWLKDFNENSTSI